MKLSDWAKKQDVSYMTCYRWFKEGKLPPQIKKAYQTKTGTIIVETEDEVTENSDPVSQLLNVAFQYAQNEKTIFDFASYVVANFNVSHKDKEKKLEKKKLDPIKEKYFTGVIEEITSKQDNVKRKKELLECARNNKIVMDYDSIENYGKMYPYEIFDDLLDNKDLDIDTINRFIQELKLHFSTDSKINEVYDIKEIKEMYEV